LGGASKHPFLRKLDTDGACVTAEDCSGEQYCAANQCLEFGTCKADKDCSNPSNSFLETSCEGYTECQEGVCIKVCGDEQFVFASSNTPIWSDEFDSGSLDASLWSYDLGGGGWGNQELQVYTDGESNVNVDGGFLKISALRSDDGGFTSGRIKTESKVSFKYGTVEASIKVPDVEEGLWPAFWTMGANFGSVGWPASGEIDIMEIGQGLAIDEGVVNQRVISGAHWEHEGETAAYALWKDAPHPLNGCFHTYKLDWTPTRMATYVDGSLVWEMDLTESSCLDCEEFHKPHFLLLNLAVGGLFTSPGCDASSGGCSGGARTDVSAPIPATMFVDWVRIYDNGYTEIVAPEPVTEPTPRATPAPITSAPTRRPTSFPTRTPTQGPTPPPITLGPTPAPTGTPTSRLTRGPTPAPVAPAPVTPAPVPSVSADERAGGSYGDPHLKTWTGRVYDFHGECDLLLAKSVVFGKGLGFEAQIRTDIRDDWSFISRVAVKIGEDVFEVQSGGLYLINGVESADLKTTTLAGFQVRKHGGKKDNGTVRARFHVNMKRQGVLEIKVYNEFVSVLIREAQSDDFHDSVGLMGSFEDGILVGRDRATVFQDANDFGFEWQVRDIDSVLFQEARFPQFPTKCTMPAIPSSNHRRLSEVLVAGGGGMISPAEAENACEHLPVEDRDACVYDVLTTGDLALAELDGFDDDDDTMNE